MYISAMAHKTSLPANRAAVLDNVEQALTHAIHLAQTRESALPEPVLQRPVLPADILVKHLEALAGRVELMEAPLKTLDQVLQTEEEQVRQHLAAVTDLSRRLADWAGRAVG